jgi:hypothetical protein
MHFFVRILRKYLRIWRKSSIFVPIMRIAIPRMCVYVCVIWSTLEGKCLWVEGGELDILKRRLLNVVCDSLKLRNFLVISPNNNQWMSSGCVNPEYTARRRIVPVFTYSAWTSVVFLLVTGIAKAYGSVKNKWTSRFLYVPDESTTYEPWKGYKLTFFVQIMTKQPKSVNCSLHNWKILYNFAVDLKKIGT